MTERKSKGRRIVSSMFTAFAVLLALYSVLGVMNQKRTGELFYFFGYRPVIILSGSMQPELETGAVVLVEKTKEVKEQDVILFHAEEILVVHRYIDTDEEGNMITKGDNNKYPDHETVSRKEVEGKVVVQMNFFAPVVSRFL